MAHNLFHQLNNKGLQMKVIKIKKISDDLEDDPGCCEDCDYSECVSDPYATGDHWHTLIECNYNSACPWGHDD